MSKDLPADNTFGIAFNTDAAKATGMLKGVFVTLKEDVMAPEDTVHINLCEHPLYPQLVKYVKNNPPRG